MNDDKKIIWKKGSSDGNQTNHQLGDETISDLAQRFGDAQRGIPNESDQHLVGESKEDILNIQNDIKDLLGDSKEQGAEKKSEKISSNLNSPTVLAAMQASEKKQKQRIIQEESKIDSIKDSIKEDLGGVNSQLDENTKKPLEEKEKNKGVEHTYYSDVSEAMKSNEPATISELLRRDRYQKKVREVFSPTSKKNITYIVGALVLLGLIAWIISAFLTKKEAVKFITEERVSSLVYSDLDTGINNAGIETEKTKQAIRKVVETKIADDTIHQIYYVGNDKFGNMRRLGVRQVFESTRSSLPDLLAQNIQNEFMHGVYKTDENHPFIILKALSYDRAFEGMKEWETTIIDDLSTYLDLPPEAGDRSLIEPGFSDDLIKNKTVRVARFVPRALDRKGIFGLIGEPDNSSEEITSKDDGVVSFLKDKIGRFALNFSEIAHAQIEFLNQDGMLSDITTQQKEVCFDKITGDRILPGQDDPITGILCFNALQCTPYECFNANGQKVPNSEEGNPGVRCSERNYPLPFEEIDTYQGQKICRSFTELLTLQNIHNKNICFDRDGKYIEGFVVDPNGNLPEGVNCIIPINRDIPVCIRNGKVELKDPNTPESAYDFCFKPLDGTTSMVDEQFQQNYTELRQQAAVIGLELKVLSLLLDLVGVDDGAGTLNQASQFFFTVAYINVIENETIEEGLGWVRRLEEILGFIDPTGELSLNEEGNFTAIGRLRQVIDLIKGLLGYKHNTAWVTLGIDYPNGISLPESGVIYAGQVLDVIEPIQQVLVLVGLMDPVSVTGQLDLVTQDAISVFQGLNGLAQTGVIDTATINIINNILSGEGSFYDGAQTASIDDYFDNLMGIGQYSEDVQALQILLYAEDYEVGDIDGLYDTEVCEAVIQYQIDNDLDPSDTVLCPPTVETMGLLNDLIKFGGYLGTGFTIGENGKLKGHGKLLGKNGPGAIDFGINLAGPESLKEGDIVLMYTFLDEETILITRHESVMTEVIKRRALDDIFNKS